MVPDLNYLKERLGRLPENIIADAGYDSEENYKYLEEKNMGLLVISAIYLCRKDKIKIEWDEKSNFRDIKRGCPS